MNLLRQNLTTYEFIIKDHRERRDQARVMGDLEAKRIQLVDRSSGLESCRLQLGGICRQMGLASCDPLQPPPPPDPEANGFGTALGPVAASEAEAVPAPLNPAPSSDFFPAEQQNSSSLLDNAQEQRPDNDEDETDEFAITRGAPPSDIASFSFPQQQQQQSEEQTPEPAAAASAATADDENDTTEEPPPTTTTTPVAPAAETTPAPAESTNDATADESTPAVDNDDGDGDDTVPAELFENEPPEMDDHSACSGSRRSTRSTTTGERDYTNF